MEEGKLIYDNDNPPDDPNELVGSPLQYAVFIKSASDLPEMFCKDVQVEYFGYHDKVHNYTKVITGRNPNPHFEQMFEHKINYLNASDIQDLLKEKVLCSLIRLSFK